MRNLFQKRRQVFRNQCLKYSRYVFNDHFVLFLFVFIGFLAVQYSQLLRSFPKNHLPIILALANPNPEITPPEAKAVRPDAIVCTGRSDYPNQVNNVLCFPFIFRGALDVGATTINEEMKIKYSLKIVILEEL